MWPHCQLPSWLVRVNGPFSKGVRASVYVLLPFLIVLGLLTGAKLRLHCISSDILYLVGLYKDLFVDGYAVSRWNLTPAPYVFPDMALLLPLLLIMPDIGYAFTLYSILFFAAFLVILVKIASNLAHSFFAAFAYTCSTALLLVALTHQSKLSELLFLPTVHAGAMFSGFIMLAIFMKAIRSGFSFLLAAGFFLVAFLGVLSDLLIIPQFVAPLAMAAAILCLLGVIRLQTAFIALGTFLAGGLLASMAIMILEKTGLNIPSTLGGISIDKWVNSFAAFISQVKWFVFNEVLFCVIFVIWLLVSVALVIVNRDYFLLARRGTARENGRRHILFFLIIFSFFSTLGTVGAPLVTGEEWFPIRHMQPLYFLPLFVLAFAFTAYSDKTAVPLRVAGCSAVLAFSLYSIVPYANKLRPDDLKLPYPQQVQCLDEVAGEYGLRYGYGDYWSAKYVTFLSRSGLRVNQLKPNLEMFEWINNPLWYVRGTGPNTRHYPEYRFILTNGLAHEQIRLRFGSPALRKECHGVEIYIYDRKTDRSFRNFLRVPAIIASGEQMPISPSSPECLGHYKANGGAWDAPGNVIIPDGGHVSVLFATPAIGEIVEIAADEDEYEIDIFNNEEAVGTLTVPTGPYRGIQARYVALPETIAGKPFDRLEVRPLRGDGNYSIGHVFVYSDSRPE